MRASAFNFWGDGTLRGRVLRIDITNRVDLIDSAMRRSGRTDIKIPILMPDEEARRQIFEVTVRKAYGFGSMVMGMIPFDGQSGVFAVPGATMGAMGAAAMSRAKGSDEDEGLG